MGRECAPASSSFRVPPPLPRLLLNEVAWDFGYGAPLDLPVRNEVFASCKPDYLMAYSLLGGEPMEPETPRGAA